MRPRLAIGVALLASFNGMCENCPEVLDGVPPGTYAMFPTEEGLLSDVQIAVAADGTYVLTGTLASGRPFELHGTIELPSAPE
jgi:hypothetical protein